MLRTPVPLITSLNCGMHLGFGVKHILTAGESLKLSPDETRTKNRESSSEVQ